MVTQPEAVAGGHPDPQPAAVIHLEDLANPDPGESKRSARCCGTCMLYEFNKAWTQNILAGPPRLLPLLGLPPPSAAGVTKCPIWASP